MNKKELLDLGVPEDMVDKIIVMHGKDIESHKARVYEAESKADTLQRQLDEAGVSLQEFRDMDVEAILIAAEEFKNQASRMSTKADDEVRSLKLEYALDRALDAAEVVDKDIVKILLDADELTLAEDGSIEGLDDRLQVIRENSAYLFKDDSDNPPPKIVAGAVSRSVLEDTVVAAARKAAGLPKE